MNSVKAADNSKQGFRELEDRIFEKLSLDYRFKEILHPFAILEKNEKHVLLGSIKEIVGKINYNYSIKSALQEIVGGAVGDPCVALEVKVAENEAQDVRKRIDKKVAKQREEEESLADVEAQKNEGKCNLIPFPIKENKVRSDLTIERHAIFAANTFKGDFRIYERKIQDLRTGDNFILRIEIGDRDGQVRGVLKQKHQEAFYKLAQIWSQQNYQIDDEKNTLYGSIELSIYDLVQRLRGDDAGHHYRSVMRLLKEMATIRVNIKKINVKNNSFDCQDFTLLSYSWYAKLFNEETLRPYPGGMSRARIRFSDFVTDNFLRKNVKALMMGPYLSLKDKGRKGTAQLLYTMLDYELSSKEKFHISLKSLCERLGLAKYRYKSDRKRILDSAVKQLNEQRILGGEYNINAYFVESENKEDWVLVTRREAIEE